MRHLKEALQDLHAMERKMTEGKAPEKELAGVREKIAAVERQLKLGQVRQAEKEEPKDADHHLRQLKEALEQLRAMERKMSEGKAPEDELAGVREKIAAVERELKQSRTGEHRDARPDLREHGEKLELAAQRIHHLRAAAEHLMAAEAHDLAHQIRDKAAAMERDVQEARKRIAAERRDAPGEEHGPQVVRELRREIERLRTEIHELRQRLEKR
jgi:DNA repair exonuclease SbcCD ATPase subunit